MTMRMPRTDERGSMPMALLVITVVMVLSALLSPIVVRQIVSTRNLEDRNTALNAAQAGLDVMMARVRAASVGEQGQLENLPECTLTGDAGAAGTTERLPYSVQLVYRDQEGNAFNECPPYSVPTTADLTATGTSDDVTRVLTATYVFRTNNTNIPGGQIQIASSPLGGIRCIYAGEARSPAPGTLPRMRVCDGSSKQQFGYTADLYLKLIYSETAGALYGMCLDSGATRDNTASKNIIVFNPCPAPATKPEERVPRFQWGLDSSSRFTSTNSGGNSEKHCLSVLDPQDAASRLAVQTNCNSDNTKVIWRSAPGVGAGMAGEETYQLVNYEQFSRCLDVTNLEPKSSYMIAWFCKQSPKGAVEWNQIWDHPIPVKPAVSKTGNIIVTKSGVPYCLKTPQSTAAGVYVTVVECKPTTGNRGAKELQWTVFHDTGDYGTSYRIQDSGGFCLTPTDQAAVPKDAHGDGTSKVKVAVCDATELQKWNAPPNINVPTPLTNLVEK